MVTLLHEAWFCIEEDDFCKDVSHLYNQSTLSSHNHTGGKTDNLSLTMNMQPSPIQTRAAKE